MGFFKKLFGEKPAQGPTSTTAAEPKSVAQPKSQYSDEELLKLIEKREQTVKPFSILGRYYTLDKLKRIPLGSDFYAVPYDIASLAEGTDDLMLSLMGTTDRIRTFLPDLDFSSKESANKHLLNIIQRTELGYQFAYAIRMNSGFCGLITVNTPELNSEQIYFPHWTVEFFILEMFEGQGIMLAALSQMVIFLKKELGVDEFYCITSSENGRCLNLLRYLPLQEIPNTGFQAASVATGSPKVFRCDLKNLVLAE